MNHALSPVFFNALINTLVEELGFSYPEVIKAINNFTGNERQFIKTSNWNILKDWLMESGAKRKWNDIFYLKRSHFIASWIKPYLVGNTLLDLLCGDGSIGSILSCTFDVTFVENDEHYGDRPIMLRDKYHNLSNFSPKEKSFDAVLIITSLHHEDCPEKIIKLSNFLSKKRIIVIENCLSPLFSSHYQQSIDVFFNLCLNETLLPNPGNHKYVQEWIRLYESYGATLIDWQYKSRIPGIPMPHDLLIFNTD